MNYSCFIEQDAVSGIGFVRSIPTSRKIPGKVKRNGFPVYLYHLKPAFADELKRELRAMKLPNVRILKQGEEFKL